MCRENKQHVFPIQTEKVSTLPCLDRGHGTHKCPVEESLSMCRLFIFTPARQVTRPRQLEGQRAESQGRGHTHTHTKALHQYYKPNRVANIYAFRHGIWIERMSFRASLNFFLQSRAHGQPSTALGSRYCSAPPQPQHPHRCFHLFDWFVSSLYKDILGKCWLTRRD